MAQSSHKHGLYSLSELKAKGIEAINRTEYHGHKIAFIHPRDAFGMLIEMIERA